MIWTRRNLVSDAMADWVIDRFEWLITTLGPRDFFENTRLILPTRSFFKTGQGRDEGTAQSIFNEVRAHMGIDHWPVDLVPRATVAQDFGMDTLSLTDIAGTFYQGDGGKTTITYDPRLMAKPCAFMGTLAHELAHYILAPHVETAPGGEEEHELLTDLTVIYAGMGVIDMQGARDVGWKGYLSSDTRAYALATFLRLKDISPGIAEPFLDSYLRKRLHRALRQRDEREHEIVLLRGLRAPTSAR